MPKTHSSKKLPALISGAAVWYFSQVCDKVSYSYLSFYKRRRSKKASVLAGSENLMFFFWQAANRGLNVPLSGD